MNLVKAGERFFFNFEGKEGILPYQEAYHLIKVLRKKEGEKIRLINGKGKEFEGEILEVKTGKKEIQVKVKLLRLLHEEKKPFFKLIALIPLLKGNRTEFLIEKATELGFTHLIPFYSTYSVKKPSPNFMRRLQNKAISALKQSGRLILPEISTPVFLLDFLNSLFSSKVFKILAYQEGNLTLEELVKEIKSFKEILILSGPEGDFSAEEKKLMEILEFKKISLSPYILRAETASIILMGLTSFLFHNQQKLKD